MNINETLDSLGLSSKEVQVLMCLQSKGTMKAKNISLETELNRATVYVVLENLEKYGLVSSYLEGKIRKYSSLGLPALLDFAEQEIYTKKQAQKRLRELENYFDLLKMEQKRTTQVSFYDNLKSIGSLYAGMIEDFGKLDENAEVFVWINPEKMEQTLPGWLLDDTHHKFNIKNFNQIMTDSDFARKYTEYLDRWNNKGLTTTKFNYRIWNGEDLFETDNVIWGDKVSFVDYSTNSGFVIENQAVANDLRTILKKVWFKL